MFRTTLCYIEENDSYLMLLRNKKEHDINKGKWIGVGGKFEEGEPPDECMKREVFEETGLTVCDYKFRGLIHFLPEGSEAEEMYLYTVSSYTGTLNTDCNEGELRFIPKSDILNLNLWEGDPFFLRKILSGEPEFHMSLIYDSENNLVECREYPNNSALARANVIADRSALAGADVDSDNSKLTVADIDSDNSEGCITCPHGFSTRIGGVSHGVFYSLNLGMNRGDDKEDVIRNWNIFLDECGIKEREFVCGEQVHGNNVVIASFADARPAFGPGHMHKADGYVTKESGLPLAIFTADCVPVLLEDPVNRVIGAVHCGWRSTVADIELKTIKKMKSLGANPADIRIEIGPAIDMCCFEVGGEVIEACRALLSSPLSDNTGIDPLEGLFTQGAAEGKYMLDLRGVVQKRFEQLGVLPQNISLVGECTMCHPELYYSHRYTGGVRGSLACVISQ